MGHVQKLSTFLFVLALALLWGGSVRAASFSASLSVEEGRPGTPVEARFFYNGTLSGVAALRIRLEYDPEVLRFQEVQYGDQLEKGEAATKNEDGVLSTVVTLPGEETSLDIGDLLVCSFLVRGDAPLEKTLLRASVFQVVDGNSEPVQEVMETELALQVLPPPSTDARLLSLVPETGQLTPAFHPEVLDYRLSVPFEVTSMTFAAQPAEGASCRVNRESLGAGGSDTLFRITVTAEDGETQRVYQVTVHRQEKEEEPELSQDTRLLSLLPETGQLVPEFEPGILEYSLTVPYEVAAMTFSAQPAEGASCRVNRKNLGAGGSSTLFTLTVTAEDGTAKRVYQVTVYRQEKAAAASPSPTRTPSPVSVGSAGTSRPSSSSTAGPAREETPAPVQSAPAEEASAAPALEPVPVIEEEGGTPSPSSTEGGSDGLVLQSGRTTSLLPGLLAGALFLLVCFLSGPIARWVNRHFPASGKEPPQQRK